MMKRAYSISAKRLLFNVIDNTLAYSIMKIKGLKRNPRKLMINRVVCDEQHSSLISVKEIFYSIGTKPVTDVAYGG
jgi:hypothetical protein